MAVMVNVIIESGMSFVCENTFYIEKSETYTSMSEGVRSVEFVRVKADKLLFVEAKTSFPNPNNPCAENFERFLSEVNEIREKFIHSLSLLSSIEVGVAEECFPSDFALPGKVSLEFVLVIKNHELRWCKQVKEKLTTTLHKLSDNKSPIAINTN